ncbi:MAG: hypothetical protein EOP80_13895 [Variovorax sp.]|nr:MAG: hypothetical protein EOP80_13895 [Variovorax sp.]
MSAVLGAPARTLEIRSPAIPLISGAPDLEPVRLSGSEGVNGLFAYELFLKTPDALNLGASGAMDFELDAFIGREISCRIELDGSGTFVPGAVGAAVDRVGAGVRQINALITDACLWGEEGRHVQYKLTLRPWLHLATLATDCKIYQNKSVVEILDELLGDYPYQWHAGNAGQAGSHYAQPRAGTGNANDPGAEGGQLALLRMQALRTHGQRAKASGNLRGMVPGCTFQLTRHPRADANAEYLILETELLIEDVAQDSQIQDAAPDRKQHWRVQVDLTAQGELRHRFDDQGQSWPWPAFASQRVACSAYQQERCHSGLHAARRRCLVDGDPAVAIGGQHGGKPRPVQQPHRHPRTHRQHHRAHRRLQQHPGQGLQSPIPRQRPGQARRLQRQSELNSEFGSCLP